MFEWIAGFVLLYLVAYSIFANYRIKKLEAQAHATEIRTNTHEMNINRLYFFRITEVQTKDTTLTPDDLFEFEQELADKNSVYGERNMILNEELKEIWNK